MPKTNKGNNCIGIYCPKCGNDNLYRLKNRNSRNHGKVNIFICNQCGEVFGGPPDNNLSRLRKE